MASLNKVQLIGNLGRDPEIRYLPEGDAICSFSVTVTEKYKDKRGDAQEKTEWIRCVAFKKLAEVCGEYLKKGSQVYAEGKMVTRKYVDKDGVEKYATEVVINTMQMLGSRPKEEAPMGAATKAQKPSGFDDMDSDLPF